MFATLATERETGMGRNPGQAAVRGLSRCQPFKKAHRGR